MKSNQTFTKKPPIKTETLANPINALHKALMAVHSAESMAEIETLLNSALSEVLSLSWVRIFFHSSEHIDNQLDRLKEQILFKANLEINGRQIGRIVFARSIAKKFKKTETEALEQISESVALALDRLAKLDLAETLKLQWESTFDAISEPLCLTDEKFQIIRTNKNFLDTTGLEISQCLNKNVFKVFCNAESPASISPPTNSIILKRKNKNAVSNDTESNDTYEVSIQRIQIKADSPSILLVMFRNITEQKKIEKQIFESAKMAELGTIGSSIAHDINNPLGGMLSFLQLIKMDLPKDNPLYGDIIQMESAGMRCKSIVENLLSFSRRQETDLIEEIDLRKVIDQALKIITLQTRALGIEIIDNYTAEFSTTFIGNFNLLSQALSYIFQNAFDAVSDKLKSTPGYKGQITVQLQATAKHKILTVTDNGIGITPEHQNKILNPLFSTKSNNKNKGLGLTLAYQIINDSRGQLEIYSQPNVGTTVKISFQNV